MPEKKLTKEESLRKRIEELEELNRDPIQRPCDIRDRKVHIEFYKKELENEIRNK